MDPLPHLHYFSPIFPGTYKCFLSLTDSYEHNKITKKKEFKKIKYEFPLVDLLAAHIRFCGVGNFNDRDGLDSGIEKIDTRLNNRWLALGNA
jgi:hypothetical protein